MMIYPLVYVLIWIIPTAIRIYQASTGKKAPFWIATIDKVNIEPESPSDLLPWSLGKETDFALCSLVSWFKDWPMLSFMASMRIVSSFGEASSQAKHLWIYEEKVAHDVWLGTNALKLMYFSKLISHGRYRCTFYFSILQVLLNVQKNNTRARPNSVSMLLYIVILKVAILTPIWKCMSSIGSTESYTIYTQIQPVPAHVTCLILLRLKGFKALWSDPLLKEKKAQSDCCQVPSATSRTACNIPLSKSLLSELQVPVVCSKLGWLSWF